MEPSLLTAVGHLVERGPRWLLRSEAAALGLLKAFHRLGWWPEGQVEEVCARLEELHRAPWRRSVTEKECGMKLRYLGKGSRQTARPGKMSCSGGTEMG